MRHIFRQRCHRCCAPRADGSANAPTPMPNIGSGRPYRKSSCRAPIYRSCSIAAPSIIGRGEAQESTWSTVSLRSHAMDIIAHLMVVGGRKAIATGKVVLGSIPRALAGERRHRLIVEDGQYRLSSKNDDDLPIVR